MQLGQLQELKPQLDELGYQIVAVSPDLPARVKQTIDELGLEYELLSDSKMNLARAMGIAFQVDKRTLERYRKSGLDLEEYTGERHHLLPVPAVFIIGSDRIIRYEYVNPNHAVRPTPEIIMAAAKMTLG
ncbi:MAG TPA: redoxin domain-containing protein [Dehalococcoidia bacterium]|nr:redoxin domain-containing protein [Dehalococcoidia bacterium]